MRVTRGLTGVEAAEVPRAVAIGNFDGVHRGHQALIARAGEAARRRAENCRLTVLTFEPHPRAFFQKDQPPFRLTLEPLKLRRLAAIGVAETVVLPFDLELASTPAEAFLDEIVFGALGARVVATGADFRFGAGRRGDAALLAEAAARRGAWFESVDPVGDGPGGEAETFSSSEARKALREGAPERAARILGDWHRIEGVVEKGEQRGRDLGFPTANLSLDGLLAPSFGVYAALTEVLDGPHQGVHPAVASLGVRPTFGDSPPNFESHLLDFKGDLYGATLSVGLVRRLRPEIAFDGADALIAQMRRDADEARTALAAADPPPWGNTAS